MNRRYLHTLVAVIILAGLVGATYFYNKRHPAGESPKAGTKPEEKLVNLDPKDVRSFTLTPRDGAPVTCKRQGAQWVIDGNPPIPADDSAVSGLLNSISTATVSDVVDPQPKDVKDYGLATPAETIDLDTGKSPARQRILVGDGTPTQGGVYVQVAGNPRVVTIASYLSSALEKKAFDLRDKRAVTLDPDQVNRIEAEAKGKPGWTLEKNAEGVWDLLSPTPVRADRFAADGLVGALRSASIESIVSEQKKDPAKYGLGSPELTLKVTSPSGSQTLELGKKDGDNYDAVNSDLKPVFTLPSSFLNQFQKDPADLRDKDLFSFATFDVKHVEIQTPKGHWALDQQKDKWKQTAPQAKDLTPDKIDGLLADLRDLRANSFPSGGDLSKFGLDKPAYRFSVRFGEKSQTEIVEAAKTGDHVYARRSTDALPSELSKDALDAIDKALAGL